MEQVKLVEKMYAGFLGMCAGIRLGAPVEPTCWTFERIKEVYGTIDHYTKSYKNFAADDDSNGPVFFIRALKDYAQNREMTAEDVGNAWLDFAREGIGMFWWGGDQVSTEHTAFLNLKKGMKAPESGSVAVNGEIMAEQIGGQIFIDTWGMLFPNDPEKAADYAEKAASVSHDQNGLYGARFMAACVSAAFSAETITEIIEKGMSVIPADSLYMNLIQEVLAFYHQEPHDFEKCRQFLEDNWGYDKYTGVCHIIPNAGICVLALLYGEGDLARTIEIATMCAWDTDCNAGNVGTILGVFNGLAGVPRKYREPINDFIVTSSVVGSLNMLDVPTFIKELAVMSFTYNQQEIPDFLQGEPKQGQINFDFELAGSTHGFRTDNAFKTELQHTDNQGDNSQGSLEILLDRMVDTDASHIFYKPFYRRSDFSDERYKPTFAPQVLSGQVLEFSTMLTKWQGEDLVIQPYIRETYGKTRLYGEQVTVTTDTWETHRFVVPDLAGTFVDEIGFKLVTNSPIANRLFGRLYLDNFKVSGEAAYTIDFAKQAIEFLCVTPFSHNLGEWALENNKMLAKSSEGCSAYTGNYYAKDCVVATTLRPLAGESHMLHLQSKGIQRGYYLGFNGQGKVQLLNNHFGQHLIQEVPYEWELGKEYQITVEAKGSQLTLTIDGKQVLTATDDTHSEGMFGYVSLTAGECEIGNFEIIEG